MVSQSFRIAPDDDDTVVAVSTASGGAIGIVRLSGRRAHGIASQVCDTALDEVEPSTMVLRRIVDPRDGRQIDEALVVLFRRPASYTGQDMAEIQCHGSCAVIDAVMDAVVSCGARPAKPGEFTLRAFVDGKMDLAQAEAVETLVGAQTRAAGRAAFLQLQGGLSRRVNGARKRLQGVLATLEALLEFPEEVWAGYEVTTQEGILGEVAAEVTELLASHGRGRVAIEGMSVVLVGAVNVGKSSIFNALLGYERAVVDEEPGTTRDFVEARIMIAGVAVRLVDTAGYRADATATEARARQLAQVAVDAADVILCVVDGHQGVSSVDRTLWDGLAEAKRHAVLNKADLGINEFGGRWQDAVVVSARTGEGLDAVRKAIISSGAGTLEGNDDGVIVIQQRHEGLLKGCLDALERAKGILDSGAEGELAVVDVREAIESLGAIVGVGVGEDVLDEIFSRFCIGK